MSAIGGKVENIHGEYFGFWRLADIEDMSASGRTADMSSPHFMSAFSSLRRLCPTLRSAFDRARLQNAGDRQSAFSDAPDNIR
jgi:hypothetical protein